MSGHHGQPSFESVLDSIQMDVKVLKADVDTLLSHVPFLKYLHQMFRIGLLTGMARKPSTDFIGRLLVAADQKANLASYLCQSGVIPKAMADATGNPERIFFESGSTVAYAIGRIAHEIAELVPDDDDPGPVGLQVFSNNAFAATAFMSLVEATPTAGTFDPHYFGYFPFPNRANLDKVQALSDLSRLLVLSRVLSSCGTIIGTCSDLSLLYGPVVGSYQNALFKRIMHAAFDARSGTKKGKMRLLLHFEKLVGLTPVPEGLIMKGPGTTCSCVFAPDPRVGHSVPTGGVAGPGLEWHRLVAARKWNVPAVTRLLEQLPPATEIQTADAAALVPQLGRSWLQGAEGIEILIGMPTDDTYEAATKWLDSEVQAINALLVAVPLENVTRRYRIVDRGNKVWRIVVEGVRLPSKRGRP